MSCGCIDARIESVAPHERGRIVVLLGKFLAAGWIIAAVISYIITRVWLRVALC